MRLVGRVLSFEQIGKYDGNVYEAQYMAAVQSPLNKSKVPDFLQAVRHTVWRLSGKRRPFTAARCRKN
jgi:hypothetical protein